MNTGARSHIPGWKHYWLVLLQTCCDATQHQVCLRLKTNAPADDVPETNKISVWFRTVWHWSRCGQRHWYSYLGDACACTLWFFIYFFIQHRGVDILESSHACYCFSTAPRLPGTSSSTSFVWTPQLLFHFALCLFLLQMGRSYILLSLPKSICLIPCEQRPTLFCVLNDVSQKQSQPWQVMLFFQIKKKPLHLMQSQKYWWH